MAKKTDNRLRLIIRNGENEIEIEEVDRRKLELINYYINSESNNGEENGEELLIESLTELTSKALNTAIDKEYKKHVPQKVREMYEGLISKSNSFGGNE